jgi:nitrite reductase/ring-hydroxylating ferredoxin subunit
MMVYPSYALLVLHVALGALQAERSLVYPLILATGMATVISLHLVAGWREHRRELNARPAPAGSGWLDVGAADEIPESRAKTVSVPGQQRIAVFRYGGCVSAVAGVCAHQGGPLAEDKIIDGCITCPWHGFQYRPEDGASPPPFTEKVPTFKVKISGERVLVHPRPNPAGTRVEPALVRASQKTLETPT